VSLLSTEYRGHDLLTVMPNAWRADRDQTHAMPQAAVGGDLGQWGATWPEATPTLGWPFKFFLDSRDVVSDFLLWLAYRRGAYAEFWLPTWRRDFQLVENAADDATELVVAATGYPDSGFQTEARRHLAAIVAGGGAFTVYPRRIEDAEANGDGTETLTLESPLGVAADRHVVLSHLVLVRLVDDEATLRWYHPNVAEAEVRMVELPRQMEEVA
jgi:hypothetical protein